MRTKNSTLLTLSRIHFFFSVCFICVSSLLICYYGRHYDFLVAPTQLNWNLRDSHKLGGCFGKEIFNRPLRLLPEYFANMTQTFWKDAVPSQFSNWSISDNKGCPLCLRKQHNPSSNSSKRDLIITLMIGGSRNMGTFVRTLRSTGSEATVVVFVDSATMNVLNPKQRKMFTNCGVNMINIATVWKRFEYHVFEYRHLLIYDFLKTYRESFDRIIVVDMADTFFQLDPFTTDFGWDVVGVTTELKILNQDPDNNTRWIKVADPDYLADPTFYDDKIALNMGFFFGSMMGMLSFYQVFLSLPWIDDFTPATIDQGYLNYLYYKGHFRQYNLSLSITHPGDLLISARGVEFDENPDRSGFFHVKGIKQIPAVIHQYNRICPVVEGLKAICPRVSYDTSGFAPLKDVNQPCSSSYIDKSRNTAYVDRMKEFVQKIHHFRE